MRATSSATSVSRPTKVLAGRGRFVFEIVLSGGNSPELEERDGLVEILQAMLAEVEEWSTLVEVVPRRRREERLPPMPGCADSGG